MSSHLNQLPRIGRGPDCFIVLAAPGVSRHHAELTLWADGRLWLRDCGSAQSASLRAPGGAARAIAKEWVERRDVPRFGQVQLSVAELCGSRSSHAEPPEARPAWVRCACGVVKLTVSVCDVYSRR